MTKLSHNSDLKRSDKFKNTIGRTHEGMAHFAGTGPVGLKCLDCLLWGLPGKSYKRPLSPRPCAKFKSMTGMKVPPRVPYNAAACRHVKRKTDI